MRISVSRQRHRRAPALDFSREARHGEDKLEGLPALDRDRRARLIGVTIVLQPQGQRTQIRDITYSELLVQIDDGRVHDVTISGNEISGHFSDNRSFVTYAPHDPELVARLEGKKVQISAKPSSDASGGFWTTLLLNALPLLLFLGVWIFMSRQMQGGAGRAMGFGKSKAKLLTEAQGHVTFEDVAGVDEAKEDLQEIVEFLRDPQKFQRLGGRIPRGVLLVGPPGTGKTLLARAIAGEASVPFFTISGSDFVEMFVGVGASRVRDMFEQAKKNAPCIVFVDEIDAVVVIAAPDLAAAMTSANRRSTSCLSKWTASRRMKALSSSPRPTVPTCSTRPWCVRAASTVRFRFQTQTSSAAKDPQGACAQGAAGAGRRPQNRRARHPGVLGRGSDEPLNEAALLAARRSKRVVTRQEFEDARDKILMGAERRTLAMTEEEKRLTAYHEGGHALVSLNMPGSVPIHKATIIPRGAALGMVQSLPESDQISQSYEELVAMMAMAMGGRVAEEMVFGHDKVTSGAASDIQQCTRVARAMVTQLGFSDKLGTVAYAEPQQEQFLGYSIGRQQMISEATQQTIDAEVRRLVKEGYDTAKRILTAKRNNLETLAWACWSSRLSRARRLSAC